jgi:hypothetical protein
MTTSNQYTQYYVIKRSKAAPLHAMEALGGEEV